MDLELIQRIIPTLFQAAIVTVEVAAMTLVLSLAVGAVIAVARFSRFFPVRLLAASYVSVIRGTPVLVQLFIVFFGGPQVGLHLEPMAAAVISFGFNLGAYMSEAIRGAILAVDPGQREAARSLGFSRAQTMRFFILPQAAPLMVRSIGVNTVVLVKSTALISTIGIVDLTYSAQRLVTSTFKPFEVFGVTAVYYLVIIYGVAKAVDWLEARFRNNESLAK
ncbi:amino acid ABC transporter permease [Shinella sp. BYT-45]|uniref:amino acid ABC transporter permease n=1 Tax=Shinella sp. BYT-45 TaxID=3377377 RepID=UPI003980FDF6